MSCSEITVVVLLTAISFSWSSIPLKFTEPGDCEGSEYFDESHLKCFPCNANLDSTSGGRVDDRTLNHTVNHYLVKSKSGFGCVCQPGSHRIKGDNGHRCEPCPDGSVASLDGFSCVKCEPPSEFDASTKTCKCSGFMSEVNEGGVGRLECRSCPGFTVSSSEGESCVPCHPSFTRGQKTCSCPSDRSKVEGGICIPNFDIIPEKGNIYTVQFESEDVRSLFFAQNLQAAAFNCRLGAGNRTACQLLANLCVLLHYSFYDASFSDQLNACTEYRKLIERSSSSLNQQIWPENSPWLYYLPDTKAELLKTNVPNHFSINSKLRIVAFRYNAYGHLVKVSPVSPREIQVCEESYKKSFSGFTFGSNYFKECTITAAELWDSTPQTGNDLIFYDLYLMDDEGKTMYPIPVLNKQLRRNNDMVNQRGSNDMVNQRGAENWQLVRRFFVKEALASLEDEKMTSVVDRGEMKSKSKIVRYIKSFEVDINLRERDGSGSIYPPVIYLSYGEVSQEDRARGSEVRVTFSISYWMSQSSSDQIISVSLTVFSSSAVVYSMFRTWIWARRAGNQGMDPMVIVQFFFYTSGCLADVFFWVNVWAAIFWFVIFKHQSVLHTLLPTPSQEYYLYVYLTSAVVLKTIQVLSELVVTATVDIFFLDWERPKTRHLWVKLMTQNKPEKEVSTEERNKMQEEKMQEERNKIQEERRMMQEERMQEEKVRKGSAVPPSSGKRALSVDVSIWRTYFVANEWLELYCYRRLNIQWHILFLILFMNILGFENLTTYDTRNSFTVDEANQHVPTSVTCRVAVGVVVYRVLAWLQLLYKSVIYEKYVKDKLQEFVDLCSVSNVSVFIWTCKRYGFYIHGRSPNGKADVGMKEMHEQLKREEDDLCSKRGLVPNTDQQTFEMLIPTGINEQYHRLRSMLTAFSHGSDRFAGGHLSRVDIDKVVPTYLAINKFLACFIEHTFKEFDYTVKEKTLAENVLDTEFDDPRDRGYFYVDSECMFKNAMFYGLEETLISFECMVFIITDLISGNFTLSAITTFAITQIIRLVFMAIARSNLTRKGLIDERFLI